MAIAVMSETPGVTAEQFEALQQRLDLVANPPRGAVAQMAGAAEGGWRVISVFDSQEAWDEFYRDRLAPALQQAGTAPQFKVWPLHMFMAAPK